MKRWLCYVYERTLLVLLKQFARVLAYAWPRNRRLVAVGAWMGTRYNDSPKYLVEYLLDKSDLRIVWIGNECVCRDLPKHERLSFRRKGSLAAALSLLRAGTWVCCISIEWDLTSWPIEGFARLINTWHGYSLKKSGNKVGGEERKASLLGGFVRRISLHRKPWVAVGSERDAKKLLVGDPDYFDAHRILRVGTPTNDYLINNQDNVALRDELKRKMSQILGFDESNKVVVYLPTWRNAGERVFSFYGLDSQSQAKWREMLNGHGAVILEKHHPRTLEENPIVGTSECSIPISPERQSLVDVNELLLVADVLVTDYSGAGQDFGVLKRPCIHFMYDLEDYKENCSGFVDGWEDMLAGPLVEQEPALFEEVRRQLENPSFCPSQGFAATCEYQTGHACEKLLDFMEGRGT